MTQNYPKILKILYFSCIVMISIYMLWIPSTVYGFRSQQTRLRAKAAEENFTLRGLVSIQAEKIMETTGALKRFYEQYGEDMHVLSRPGSDNIYRIIGGNIRLNVPRGFTNGVDMTDACLKFIRENQDLFGLDIDEIELLKSTHRGGIGFVDFGQTYKGFCVFGSRIAFILTDAGDVMSITLNHFPEIDLSDPKDTDPKKALTVALSDLEAFFPGSDFALYDKQLTVYPIQDQGNIHFVWAWIFEFREIKPLKKWQYIVEAETGIVLRKKDLGRYIISGQIKGQILPRYAEDNPVDVPLSNLKVICLRDNPALMYKSLDSDPGWLGTAPYGWEFGQPIYPVNTAGGPGPDSGHTGLTFYGFNLNGCYPLNMWSPQYLTTLNPVNCSGKKNIYLKFWRWLGVEGSEADHASLEIADGPTSTWWKIWQNPEEDIYDGGWRLILYDISKWADGRENIFFRWGMGPTNGYVSYCGWNIDDIGVYTSTSAATDLEGGFTITGEAQKNILCSYMEGTYFKIINDDGADVIYTKNNVLSGTNAQNLNFTRITDYDVSSKMGTVNSLADIDEINTYYHANLLVKYIREIDPEFWLTTSDAFPIKITVHYDREYTNSFWMPGEGIFFGEGDKLEYGNFAHFADIIYHECSHAVTDSIYESLDSLNRGIDGGKSYAALSRFTEFDAMHEAFSDYWACTITNDSKIAEGGFWIDHDYVRDLNNDLNYLLNYGQELYQSSLILSAAMWDLRQELRKEIGDEGIRVADTIFHFARLAKPTTYLDFLIDCLIVDQVKYNSVHTSVIKDIFGKRGISQAPQSPNLLVVTFQNQGASLVWSQSPEAIGYYLYYGPNRTTRPLIEDKEERYVLYMQDGGGSGESSSEGGDREEGGGSMEGGGGSGSSSSTQNTPSSSNTSSNNGNSGTAPVSSNAAAASTSSKLDVGNSTSYFLTGLNSTVTYKVQVSAYNIYGVESPPSEEALIPGSGSDIQADETADTSTSTDLNWDTETNEVGLNQGVACFIHACESSIGK